MNSKTHHRSVELKHCANQAKVDQIAGLLHWFSSACAVCKTEKIRHLKTGGKVSRFTKSQWLIGKPDVFSARMFKSVENVVDAALKSWQELSVTTGRKIIGTWQETKPYLNSKDFVVLYTLNKSKRWWDPEAEFPELRDELITEILRKNPFPVLDGKTVTLDGIVCSLVESEFTKQESWLEIRGFKGSPIYIPVEKTSFYSEFMSEGKECSVTQLHLDRDGKLFIYRIVEKTNVPLRQGG